MSNINAKQVKDLRDQTGASVMECKAALENSDGDIAKSIEYLRRKGKEKAAKKADRATGEGIVASYIHGNGKIGSLVALRCETDFVAKNEAFQSLAHDLAMHITAMNPQFVDFDSVPEAEKNAYTKLIEAELAEEKKPDEIKAKILEGKVKKHFEELSLMSQSFIKNPELTISDLIKENVSTIGENIQVESFTRFEI